MRTKQSMGLTVNWVLVVFLCSYSKSANGFLFANVTNFCEQNSTAYDLNVGEIINTIQEDSSNPGAILAVVIMNSKTSMPNSRLLRLHSNGKREWVAGTSLQNVNAKQSFLWISSFLQHNRTTMLIADSKLRCIRSIDMSSGDVNTYSGDCSYHHMFESVKMKSKVKDGYPHEATYSQPNELYQSPSLSNKILVCDYHRVREIDLASQYTQTKITFNVKIQSMVKKAENYLVAFYETIALYDQHWSYIRELVGRWITRLDVFPATSSSRTPIFHYTGTVNFGDEASISGWDFQIVDLGYDLIILYLNVDPCPFCSLNYPPDNARAVAVYSMTGEALVFMLYDGLSDNDVLSIYPKTAVISNGKNRIYFSTNDARSDPTFCSVIKTLDVTDYCLTEVENVTSCAIHSEEKSSHLRWYNQKPYRLDSCPYNQTQLLYCMPHIDNLRQRPQAFSDNSPSQSHRTGGFLDSGELNTSQSPKAVQTKWMIVISISISAFVITTVIVFSTVKCAHQLLRRRKFRRENFSRGLDLSTFRVERPLPDRPNETAETDTTYYSIISYSTDQEATNVSVINSTSSAAVHPGTYVDGAKLADIE